MIRVMLFFLGTGTYYLTRYQFRGESAQPTQYVQMALLELMEKDRINFYPDLILPILTPTAKSKNWVSSSREEDKLEKLIHNWAMQQVEQRGKEIKIEPIEIGETGGEALLWQVFRDIYERIDRLASKFDGVELLVDVTHSYRYQPMLMLALLHFIRVVRKDVQIQGVYYGNQPEESDHSGVRSADVLDLSPIVELQEWILNVYMFLQGSNASPLNDFIQQARREAFKRRDPSAEKMRQLEDVTKSWETLTQAIQLCRAPKIPELARRSVSKLQEFKEKATRGGLLPSFQPILMLLDQIENEIKPLADENEVEAGLAAIRWCQQHGLMQQAYTLLNELIITTACSAVGKDPLEKNDRQIVSSAMNSEIRRKYSDTDSTKLESQDDPGVQQILMTLRVWPDIFGLLDQVSKDRNNLNHAGWGRDNTEDKNFLKHLEEQVERADAILPRLQDKGGKVG